MKSNLKFISRLCCLVLLSSLSSCYKPKTKSSDNDEKESIYYSLKISTNNQEANNYSVNVDNLDKITEGTEVTITNTPGHYKIVQFLYLFNELLSENNSYSFTMDSNKELKIFFTRSDSYLHESNGNISEKEIANVILMSGQSNMCGADDPYTSIPVETRNEYKVGHDLVKINYNGLVANNYTYGEFGNGVFVPVDFGQGAKNTWLGPEVGLSKYLGTNDPTTRYYLVKVAWGGSKIGWWVPNNTDAEGKNAWGKLIFAVDKCLERLKSIGKIPVIKSMLWFQGESDSVKTAEFASTYASKFVKFKNGLLKRYNSYISSDFEWISAGISTLSTSAWTYCDIINEQLKENSDKYINETETLTMLNNSHYTAQSYLTIGELFGRYYLS